MRSQAEYLRVKAGFAALLDVMRATEPPPAPEDMIAKYGITREAWDAIPAAPAREGKAA